MTELTDDKVMELANKIERECGGDCAADWIAEDAGLPFKGRGSGGVLHRIRKVLRANGFHSVSKNGTRVAPDRKTRDWHNELEGTRRLDIMRRDIAMPDTDMSPADHNNTLQKMLDDAYNVPHPHYQHVNDALTLVMKLTGLRFTREGFAKHNITRSMFQRARHTCMEALSRLDNYCGLPHLTICSVLRANIQRMLNNTGEIPTEFHIYHWLMGFENSFHVAVGDWNSITQKQINNLTEDDVVMSFDGIKKLTNPLKLKDSKDFYWQKHLDWALRLVSYELGKSMTKAPFGKSLDDCSKTAQGRVAAKGLIKAAKAANNIKDGEDLAKAICFAFRSEIHGWGDYPDDKKVLDLMAENAEYYAENGEYVQ